MIGRQQLGVSCIKESPLLKMVNALHGLGIKEEQYRQDKKKNISSNEIVRLIDSGEELIRETSEFIDSCKEFVEESSKMMQNLNNLTERFNEILEEGYDIKIIKVPKGSKFDITIIDSDNITEF